ncbi:reduced folate transporter [Gambusia affinis]|uniref:reduced folate transporter n=1 Tax=Gambusia affinis TaxID=33528 RepID=UPI001CDBFD8F|nr:reduced folate transporter [Gambusia affinis]XP_043965678.1 reduced folate transporter [Gambusia affinis]
MAADGAAAGEDVDLKTPPPSLEDGEGRGDPEAAAAPCPAEDVGKLKYSVIFLCFYGFMTSIRPGESFITPNLLSFEKNFTREQVTNEITPVLTYSYMAVLVPAFLLTDLLRYKPVLIIQGVSHVVIWVLMLLGTTLLHMQLMEFFYGITMACRVAYSSYIFSLVSPALYQRVAGYSRSSVLLGVFVSSVLGQLCLSLGNISYHTLDAITLGYVSFGLALACCLPWPKRSLFFNRTKRQEAAQKAALSETGEMNPTRAGLSSAACWKESIFVQMLLEVGNMVKRPNLRLWSLWWIFNSTGYYLVLFYVHILWNKVLPSANYNGAVEAAATLLSAITSFMAGFAKIRWNVWSELVIGGITALQAIMLLVMGTTGNIWVCYSCYILFRGFYQFLVPIATFQIASSLTRELCALVFGINTFLGTVLKSIINLIFSDKRGLGLDVGSQFRVYFVYFTLLTLAYVIGAAVVLVRRCRTQNRGQQEEASPDGLHTELTPVSTTSEAEPLSNSQSVKA